MPKLIFTKKTQKKMILTPKTKQKIEIKKKPSVPYKKAPYTA
jgi:hypothetical protein